MTDHDVAAGRLQSYSCYRDALFVPLTDDVSKQDVMPYYTAIVTLLAIAFYFFLATRVAVAHSKFGVRLPATTGNPDFERIFRAHMNTFEWMPTFLVPLWLCAIYLSDTAATVLGLVWIVGRALYFAGYSRAVEKRLPGFFIQSSACLLLFIGAAAGVVMHLAGR
jgi:glutathione S-transferase